MQNITAELELRDQSAVEETILPGSVTVAVYKRKNKAEFRIQNGAVTNWTRWLRNVPHLSSFHAKLPNPFQPIAYLRVHSRAVSS